MPDLYIDLLRHGAVDGPPALYGRTDVALAGAGLEQMQGAPLAADYALIVSSPRRRCLDFARQVAARRGVPLEIDAGLAEMDFGLWDGVPFAPDAPHWEALQRFWQAPAMQGPPGGESLDGFRQRVLAAFRDRVRHALAARSGQVRERPLDAAEDSQLWVVHAGVIRAVLAEVLGADFSVPAWHLALHIGHGSLTRLRVEAQGTVSVRCIGCSPQVLEAQ